MILAVNLSILSATGMDANALFTTTAIAAIVGTLIMAFILQTSVCTPFEWDWMHFCILGSIGNGLFLAICIDSSTYRRNYIHSAYTFNVREAIVDSIPKSVKTAISAGIGLFIAFIGLQNAGVVVKTSHISTFRRYHNRICTFSHDWISGYISTWL